MLDPSRGTCDSPDHGALSPLSRDDPGGSGSPGEYDDPTRAAIRAFQWHENLGVSGWLDRDTFAMLPTDDRPDKDAPAPPTGAAWCE